MKKWRNFNVGFVLTKIKIIDMFSENIKSEIYNYLLESYDQIFISFLLLTDLDAVFNGLYWSLYVKLQVQTAEVIFIEKNQSFW